MLPAQRRAQDRMEEQAMCKSLIAAVACVAAIALGAETEGNAEAADPPTITVSGTGKISAAPDLAEISLGVLTHGPTARQALAANSEAMAALLETIKQQGVAAKDVQTTQIQIAPQYSQPRPGQPQPNDGEFVPRVVGYRVVNTVQVTARDISRLGTLLDAVVSAGANQMYGISFHIDQADKLLDEARKRAMADAKRKAELLAGEAGVVLGAPRSIQESGGPAPQPRMFMAGAMSARGAAVPVAAGEQELSVSVQVVYELKLPK
jgi:uncharacterized protein